MDGLFSRLSSVIGFASVASAQTPSNAIYTYRYNHIANGEYMQYFDFSAASTVAGHLNFQTYTFPSSGSLNVKYYDIKQYTAGVNKCLDYTFFAPPGHAVPDLKMWANTGSATSPNWVQLSDDSGVNGARLPHAKVWISGSVDDTPTRIRVSAYDTGSNTNDFFANVIDLGGTQAQCEVPGGSSGVLRIISGTATVVVTGP